VPPSGTAPLHVPSMSANAARQGGSWGTPTASNIPTRLLLLRPSCLGAKSLSSPRIPCCLHAEIKMENKPQTLKDTKNLLTSSAQVHSLYASVKASNLALHYINFPIKGSQTGPRPQMC